MKKTILTVAVLGAVASSAFAQGFAYFAAGAANSTKISTNSVINGGAAGRTAGDNTYYYALFASSSQTSVSGNALAFSGTNNTYVFNAAGWTFVGMGANTGATTGAGTSAATSQTLNGGSLYADNSLGVPGIAGGAAANVVAIGWSANIGSTLAAVEAWYANPTVLGWIGESRVGVGLTLGDNGLNSTPNVFGTATTQFNAFTLGEVAAVPEPGTIALAALGGASLLMFRRKK